MNEIKALKATIKELKVKIKILKSELKLSKQDNKQLNAIIMEKEETSKPIPQAEKTVNDYNANDFCKQFQLLFKKYNGQGLVIPNWLVACNVMKSVMSIFEGENQTKAELLDFLDWAAQQRTHTGDCMHIGYLPHIIQAYRMGVLVSKEIVKADPSITADMLEDRMPW